MAGQLKELSRRALRHNYRRINPHDTRVVLVEGQDGLLASMGRRLSRLTARDLTRMGVEIHLEAMVTNLDDEGVEITQKDGTTTRIPAAHQGLGRRHAGLGLGPCWPGPPASTRPAGWSSSPTAPCPGTPRSSWSVT